MTAKPPTLSLAEIADACLQHLVQNPDQLAEFMMQSGISPADLRGLVGTEGFNHGLVDYVVNSEPLLLAIASEAGVRPDAITRVWAKLHRAEA